MGNKHTGELAERRERLSELTLRDEHRLARRLAGTRKISGADARANVLAEIDRDLDTAAARVARRRAGVPAVDYPAELPVSARAEDLKAAIRDNQVVVVAGETGSGKTTQIPKMCLELGRGVRGAIGHTQPRRLAARTVSERIAEELDTELGGAVGYTVRFTDRASEDTLLKVMTDGILLAEIQRDKLLRAYDTVILDEAHERSLNIDFLLGYLSEILPRRPDLKVIITSATIDPERFSRHFGDAPIVEVSGRTYPVEVRYRPVVDPDDPDADPDRDQASAIGDAARELSAEGPGDILVFLSGEREIRDTEEALAALELPETEILPLYARLSHAEQRRVFQPHRGRRIVLATNVAETSLTVPGIRYVIDPGTARISRYSNRLKVQRLPIEPISQASANQRKGRCGRLADGICIRLYSEGDFDSRPEFTDPEILRTNLASVILAMLSLGLGDIAGFPFVEPPDRRAIDDGFTLLAELGAVYKGNDGTRALTRTGRDLAALPVDPRLARMVVEAGRNGCAREVTVLAAALAIQDPRERPAEKQQAADAAHRRFADPESDFSTLLNLWNYLREQRRAYSGNKFRKLCRDEYLNYLRVREWQDVAGQLRSLAESIGITQNTEPADSTAVHSSLLAGLLSHVGLKDGDGKNYLGARGAKFGIFPGSALAGSSTPKPAWVMVAELVETSRLWGRIAAKIDSAWIEPLAGELVRRQYSEPHWERKRGSAVASERVTLFGIPIVVDRKVAYGRIDPEVSRELFIRHALVEGDWDTRYEFYAENTRRIGEVQDLENRARRRDLLIDDEALYTFYDARIPAHVVSARHFDSWWKEARKGNPDLLTVEKETLLAERAAEIDLAAYPDALTQDGIELPAHYRFEPGAADDGVTVRVPLPALESMRVCQLAWQVPGVREDLVVALLRSLPKALRRNFVPAPDYARALVAQLGDDEADIPGALATRLRAMTGVVVPPDAWDRAAVPAHLKVNYQVTGSGGQVLDSGRDLGDLQRRMRPESRELRSGASDSIERSGLTEWDFETLPRTHRQTVSGHEIVSHPALLDEGGSVAIHAFDSEQAAERAMFGGTRRLLLLGLPSPVKEMQRRMGNRAKLVARGSDQRDLLGDCVAAAVDSLVAQAGGPAWDRAGFEAIRERVRGRLTATALEVLGEVQPVLDAAGEARGAIEQASGRVFAHALPDVREQLAALVPEGFVTAAGRDRLPALRRHLRGIAARLDKLPQRPDRDAAWQYSVEQLRAEFDKRIAAVGDAVVPDALLEVPWMLEELRISYFAQTLGTAYPVSEKRVRKVLEKR
jgi:ATP-dependent helicase HrpA